jgi:hypothetical protein
MRRALPVLICLLMMSPAVLSEQFYKWQDEKGVWHYSAKPPKDQPADKLQVRASASKPEEDEEGEEEEAADKSKTETPESANCKAARNNLYVLNTNREVAKDLDGDGEVETLTLDQHQEEIALAERMIAAFCKPEKTEKPDAEAE